MRNRKSNPEAVGSRDWTCRSHKPECILTIKSDRSVITTIITWHFNFTLWMLVFSIEMTNMVLEARAVSRTSPIVASRGAPWRQELSPHNARRQGTLRPWRATLIPLILACLNPFKRIHPQLKHINNESANIIESCYVAFDTNDCCNFP